MSSQESRAIERDQSLEPSLQSPKPQPVAGTIGKEAEPSDGAWGRDGMSGRHVAATGESPDRTRTEGFEETQMITPPEGSNDPISDAGRVESGGESVVWPTRVPPCSQEILALRDRILNDQEIFLEVGLLEREGNGRGRASSARNVPLDESENRDPIRTSHVSSQRLSGQERTRLVGGKSLPRQKAVPGGRFVRRLSLKELRLLIEDVYASKETRDARCLACGLPKETLAVHLVRWLTQKFGLRALIAEWLAAVLTAVAAFSAVDAYVDIFGKIILNQLDEGASLLHVHLRKSVVEAVGNQVRAKHPYAPVDDIAALVNVAMRGAVALQNAAALLREIFSPSDCVVITKQLEEHVEAAARRLAPAAKGAAPAARWRRTRLSSRRWSGPAKIAMADLMEILLRHQSDVRWLALQPLVQVFPSFSGGGPALRSDADVVALLRSFHPGVTDTDVRKVLRSVEQVSGDGPVTFSDCVVLLTQVVGEEGGAQQSSS